MTRLFSILVFVLLTGSLSAQFRLATDGFPSLQSTVDDSTYVVTINTFSDQTGGGYSPINIAVGFQLFTSTGKLYRVSFVNDSNFSGATITVIEVVNSVVNTNGPPNGQSMIFDPEGRDELPQVPFGSNGAGSVLQAAVVSYNAKVPKGGVSQPPEYLYFVSDVAAALAGIPIDGSYRVDSGNKRGLPRGTIVTRQQ